jgi:hypothetical protein
MRRLTIFYENSRGWRLRSRLDRRRLQVTLQGGNGRRQDAVEEMVVVGGGGRGWRLADPEVPAKGRRVRVGTTSLPGFAPFVTHPRARLRNTSGNIANISFVRRQFMKCREHAVLFAGMVTSSRNVRFWPNEEEESSGFHSDTWRCVSFRVILRS